MNQSQIKVLLIEDDPGDADLLEELLSEKSIHLFDLEWANTLQAGLEQLDRTTFDVILLDLTLSDSQGLETFTRTHRQAGSVPIVVLSDLDDERVAIKAVQEGAQDYLVKGEVDAHLLTRALRYAIERKRAEEQVVRLYQAERARYREAEALRRAALAMASTIELDQVLERILVELQNVVPYDSASVMLLSDEMLDIVVQQGLRLGRRQFSPLPVEAFPHMQELFRQRRPVIIPNTAVDDRWQRLSEAEAPLCWLGVPLLVQDRVTGLLNLNKMQPGFYTEQDAEVTAAFVSHAAVAIDNAQLFKQVRAGHKRLQSLSSRLVEVQENERRHIARELHDEIGQVLTGLKMILEMCLSSPPQVIELRLRQALELVDDLTTRVQELSLDLRPAILDDLGLLPTLAWHFKRYTAQTGVQVNFKYIGPERRFRPEVETVTFRVGQEALTNVARYAGVDEVTVQLWVDREFLRLQIEDQGVGFDRQAALAANDSSGLSGMQERVGLLGGQLTIETMPGAGTCLIAEFPLGETDDPPDGGEGPI